MKKYLLLLSILITTTTHAAEFRLKPEASNIYVSINECLYAVARATKVFGMNKSQFLYKEELWDVQFNTDDNKLVCTLVGQFIE
jgi:hypothetical protein